MKTYKELEREAYMAGNTELAKLYAELDDIDRVVKAYEELRRNHE
jgi:hypothetical protein